MIQIYSLRYMYKYEAKVTFSIRPKNKEIMLFCIKFGLKIMNKFSFLAKGVSFTQSILAD